MRTATTPVIVFLLLLSSIYLSCKKKDLNAHGIESERTQTKTFSQTAIINSCDSTVCKDCTFQEATDEDTTESRTILGNTYINPYSIQAMTQAYNNIHGTNLQSVPTRHYYVRFKPDDSTDLHILDSLDVELFDYPLDKEVVQDGDYWPDAYANLSPGEIPWLYTVVESGFQYPAGINYEILAQLNIPDDDATLEDEAFSLTGNSECDNGTMVLATQNSTPIVQNTTSSSTSSPGQITPNVLECGAGYHWDYFLKRCVPDNCPDGYHWDDLAQQCVQDPPPPPQTNLHPQGMITFNIYDDYGVAPQHSPLKYTRVVGKRFFKIDKTFTDANGNFQFSKRFPHKVSIVVKMKLAPDQGGHIVKHGSWLLGEWRHYYPIRKRIGTFKGNNLQNLSYTFGRGSNAWKWKTRRWLSCIALNTILETSSFLTANAMTPLHDNLKIWLNPPDNQEQNYTYKFVYVSTPTLRHVDGGFFESGSADVSLDWLTADINLLTASKATINLAQQLTIDYLYRITGHHHWNDYKASISYNSGASNKPFGSGIPVTGYNPQLIAIWQCLAQHVGHTIANRFFGSGEDTFKLQGKTWSSTYGTSSSSAKYLEQFDPNVGPSDDLFYWIPVGLITDLIDSQNESTPVVDNVSGFSYSDIETALQNDPVLMLDFKNALKAIRPTQTGAIDQLFLSYGY